MLGCSACMFVILFTHLGILFFSHLCNHDDPQCGHIIVGVLMYNSTHFLPAHSHGTCQFSHCVMVILNLLNFT